MLTENSKEPFSFVVVWEDVCLMLCSQMHVNATQTQVFVWSRFIVN